MKTSSSSTRPTERTSWRWVPSPQSNSSRSPPRRTSVAGRPRRALGAEPAVPRKRTSRSMGPILTREPSSTSSKRPRRRRRARGPSCARGARRRSVGLPGLKIWKPSAECSCSGRCEWPNTTASARRRTGGACARAARRRRPGVVDHRDAGARRLDHALVGQQRAQPRRVHVAVHALAAAGRSPRARAGRRGREVARVQEQVGRGDALDARCREASRAPRQVSVGDDGDGTGRGRARPTAGRHPSAASTARPGDDARDGPAP